MRWFWKKRKQETLPPDTSRVGDAAVRATRVTSPRANVRSSPLAGVMEPRDELLAFARDLLNAQGARVRVEENDLITATLPDGGVARYTTTLARAHAEEETALLTQGAPALDTLFEVAERQARITAAVLPRASDPTALALRALTSPTNTCGRCIRGGRERWQAGVSTCDNCPLRDDAPMLLGESKPISARIVGWEDEPSIELSYRITGRDRRGRHDEWRRLAFNFRTGDSVPPLTLDQLASAQPASATTQRAAPADSASGAAIARAREALQPGMEALSAYLVQRVGAEFQRRAEDLTATHERLKRERPNDAHAISTSLERELMSLADVYGIEIEASLEAVCYITSPIALVTIETGSGAGLTLSVDAGRGIARPPACAGCGAATSAGRVCARGHVYCASCAEVCAQCDAMRCPACGEAPLTSCGLCQDPLCATCARTCGACGERFCADHVWACVEGDRALCLEDLILCDECQAPLCQTHAASCSVCGEALCPRHARGCKTGGETLCAAHASACVTCHQPLCATHTSRCEECGQAVCSDDIFTCLGCGRSLCACSSPAPCSSCDASYCASCRDTDGACPACRSLISASGSDLMPLRLAAEREPAISLKRKWMMGRNTLTRVYIARGLGREEAYLISEQGDIIATHRKGWRAR